MATATVQVNIRLAPALYEKVKREAKVSKRTVTAVIATALEQAYAGKTT